MLAAPAATLNLIICIISLCQLIILSVNVASYYRYASHTLLSILNHHMVPLRIIAICISEMSYISQTERVKCRVEGCPFRYEKSLLRKNYKQHLIDSHPGLSCDF